MGMVAKKRQHFLDRFEKAARLRLDREDDFAAGAPVDRDRRWTTLFERIAALHGEVRLVLRLPPPTGMR